MGCVSSKPDINDRHPNIFQVTNVNDQGKSISSGQLEVTENELVLYQRNKEPTVWPLRSLRKYGFDAGIFSFECGRRCPTGQGIYAFHCRKAEQLFNIVQHNIQRNTNDETTAGGGGGNAGGSVAQQMAAQGGGDFPMPQNSTGPPVISRRSIPSSMTTTASQQQPEVYLNPVAAVVNSVRPTPIPPAAPSQPHPTLGRPGSIASNTGGGGGGCGPSSPTSVSAMTTATAISPPPVLISGCNSSTTTNLIATHFTGTTTTVTTTTTTTVTNTNDISSLTEHNNNNVQTNGKKRVSLVPLTPSMLPPEQQHHHHQYTNTAGAMASGMLISSSSDFATDESLSPPPPPPNPPSSPPVLLQQPQQVNYANLGLTSTAIISSTNNANSTTNDAVMLNEGYMNMLDSPCHVYMNVETGGVIGTNPQTITKEPPLMLPALTTNFSNNGIIESAHHQQDFLALNGSKEKILIANQKKEMQEPIAELKSESEEFELEDDTPLHSYANIDAKDFEHLRPLLLSHRNNSLIADSIMNFPSSAGINSSSSVPQTPTAMYNNDASQTGSCHQEYFYQQHPHEVNYAELDLDCKNHNFFAAGLSTSTTKNSSPHPMTSQDHQDFTNSTVSGGGFSTKKSPDSPTANKIEQKKSYATIDFQKTNALSQSVNPHNMDIEEGSRKTRHNSTISDVTNVATTGAACGGGRHSNSLSD